VTVAIALPESNVMATLPAPPGRLEATLVCHSLHRAVAGRSRHRGLQADQAQHAEHEDQQRDHHFDQHDAVHAPARGQPPSGSRRGNCSHRHLSL